jgi:hypothetical protein
MLSDHTVTLPAEPRLKGDALPAKGQRTDTRACPDATAVRISQSQVSQRKERQGNEAEKGRGAYHPSLLDRCPFDQTGGQSYRT